MAFLGQTLNPHPRLGQLLLRKPMERLKQPLFFRVCDKMAEVGLSATKLTQSLGPILRGAGCRDGMDKLSERTFIVGSDLPAFFATRSYVSSPVPRFTGSGRRRNVARTDFPC